MTAKLSHIIGLNKSINTATNNKGNNNNRRVSSTNTNGKRKRQDQGGGSGDGNGSSGGGGNASDKQPLWKTNPYKEKIESKFYPEKIYLGFSPEQRIKHYDLGGAKGQAGLMNRSVQAAASSKSDTGGAGENFRQNARAKRPK